MKPTKAVSFKKGHSKISFSGEYDSDPKAHKDWSLNVLVVPDERKPDHDHFLLSRKEIGQLHVHLGKLIDYIDGLKNKKSK